MKRALALALFAICVAPSFASVDLNTSINDVFNRGTSERTGSITWTVDDNDFEDAATSEPIFIRVTPDHNSFLAETLVNQNSTNSVINQPIFLAMKLDGGNDTFSVSADPEAISVVRWVAGESSLWIRVQQSSSQWLVDNSAGGAFSPPQEGVEVSWGIGISARISDRTNDQGPGDGGSNLPFNTRDSSSVEDDFDEATSTLICVDLSSSNLLADGSFESLLNFDIIAFDSAAEVGNGVYNGNAGNDTNINFPDNRVIARGKDRSCEVAVIGKDRGSSGGDLCIPADVENATQDPFVVLCRSLVLSIDCEDSGNFLATDLLPGSFVRFDTNGNGNYGFRGFPWANLNFLPEDDDITASPSGDVRFVADTDFVNNGERLWRQADLVVSAISDADSILPQSIGMNVCVWQHYTDDPITATVDWQLVLVTGEDPRDTAPLSPSDPRVVYDGDDQFRDCPPSEFAVNDPEEFTLGSFRECTGVPVVNFYPYVPRLVGQGDFWIGLSYVNQGPANLDVEAIFYNEDGGRFSADMGGLDSRNQKTWLLTEVDGAAVLSGAGGNNDGETPAITAANAADEGTFGETRMSMFIRGTFTADFLEQRNLGDLDGYLLIGNKSTFSVDGAYLPRNFEDDGGPQTGDLPIFSSKQGDDAYFKSLTRAIEMRPATHIK